MPFSSLLVSVLITAAVIGLLMTAAAAFAARWLKAGVVISAVLAMVTIGQAVLCLRAGNSLSPLRDGFVWPGWLAALAAVGLLVVTPQTGSRRWSSVLLIVLALGGAAAIAYPLVRPNGVLESWFAVLPFAALLTIATLLYDRIIDRQNPRLAALTVLAWSAGIATTIAASGSLRLFEITGIFAAAVAGATLVTLLRPSALPGLGAGATLMLGWLLLAALWYADLTRVAGALLLTAPLGLGLAHAGRTPRLRTILAAVGVLTLLGAAVAWTLIYGQPAASTVAAGTY